MYERIGNGTWLICRKLFTCKKYDVPFSHIKFPGGIHIHIITLPAIGSNISIYQFYVMRVYHPYVWT